MPTIQVNGDKLHYFDVGNGTPIVFVHGSCGGGGQWKSLAAELSRSYRCISLDLFGSGASEAWPLSRKWAPNDDERAINAVLDRLAEPAHLVAHSGGGHFSYPILKSRRDQILSLSLFEPTFFHLLLQENNPLFSWPKSVSEEYRAAIEDGNLDQAMAIFVDGWAQKKGVWAGFPDAAKNMMKQGAHRLYHEALFPWIEEPACRDLAALNLPVLLFKGTETVPSMHRICEIVRGCLPNCRYVEIQGAGHMSPFTHSKAALPQMNEFFQQSRRTAVSDEGNLHPSGPNTHETNRVA
ncbi:MAG: alpha/beta hydrolase [Rhodobacteraceae bacterium]|nr:alpha/beta hydrolase [Paracoccaceae bacterium]